MKSKRISSLFLSLILILTFTVGLSISADADSNTGEIVDLVPTSRVYVSSSYYANATKHLSPLNMMDNDNNTYWGSRENSDNTLGRVIVDLGEEIPISHIDFVPGTSATMRKNFSVYVTNDNEFIDMTQLITFGIDEEATKNKVYSLYPDGNYRYIVAQTNATGPNFGLAELRVYADKKYQKDNRIINISGQASAFASTSYSSAPAERLTDLTPSTVWTSANGHSTSADDDYVYIDLGADRKIDSISLIMCTPTSEHAVANAKKLRGDTLCDADFRSDFQIVARKDNATNRNWDTVLIDHTTALADNGTINDGVNLGASSNLCVFEIPDEYKNEKFRFIGVRKRATEKNNKICQMAIATLNVYGKVSENPEPFGNITASYDKSTGEITASFAGRTAYDNSYQLLAAYYGTNDELVGLDTDSGYLKNPSSTIRDIKNPDSDDTGSEIMDIYYPSSITKTFAVSNPEKVSYAKIFLWNCAGGLNSKTDITKVSINPELLGKVQLLQDSVRNYMETPIITANIADFGLSTRKYNITWNAAEGASSYTLYVSTDSAFGSGVKEYSTTDNSYTYSDAEISECYYWKAVSDTGVESTGSFYGDDSKQKPYTIEWNGNEDDSYELYLSTKEDYSNAKVYMAEKNSCEVTNLFIGTQYYWKAVSNSDRAEYEGSFITDNTAPRFITVDGISNVRDLGGRMTDSGKRVKQGLIYRGTEMNASKATGGYDITDSGIKCMTEELGIKTDIDFRSASESKNITESPLVKFGANVEYQRISISPYGTQMRKTSNNLLTDVMKQFTDINNYPIYFHCWGGADRTGTVAYLINALLGVSDEELIRDYEATSFSQTGARSRQRYSSNENYGSIVEYISEFDGDTTAEKTENYMKQILTLSQSEIDTIREIMLEY